MFPITNFDFGVCQGKNKKRENTGKTTRSDNI
jgi:hypothetical protein